MKSFWSGIAIALTVCGITFYLYHLKNSPIEIITDEEKNTISNIILQESSKKLLAAKDITPAQEITNDVENKAEYENDEIGDGHDHQKEFGVKNEDDIEYTLAKVASYLRSDANDEEVVRLLEDILNIDPKNEKALTYISNFYSARRNTQKAKIYLEKCISLYTENELCNGNLSNLYFESKEAKKYIDQCLKNTPNNFICIFNQATFEYNIGEFGKSYRSYKFLESNLDTDSYGIAKINTELIYFGVAKSAKAINKMSEAREYFERACGLSHEQSCIEFKKIK